MCTGVCVSEMVCVSLDMTHSETPQAVSSALSPVSMGVQNSYMTPPSAHGAFKTKQKIRQKFAVAPDVNMNT